LNVCAELGITTSTVRQTPSSGTGAARAVDLTAVTAINIAATADNNVRLFEYLDMAPSSF
jgi:hypothetical protein